MELTYGRLLMSIDLNNVNLTDKLIEVQSFVPGE